MIEDTPLYKELSQRSTADLEDEIRHYKSASLDASMCDNSYHTSGRYERHQTQIRTREAIIKHRAEAAATV